jgi:tripartite-type tricarboxylate transporter receptor subunit TctC
MAPETLGRPFLVSGRVPAAQVAALRRAFAAMLADPDFRKDADSMSLAVAPMSGEEVAGRRAARRIAGSGGAGQGDRGG